MIKRNFVPLCITKEDINKCLYLQGNWKAILYWQNIIMSKVKQGNLCNDKKELIRWMTGIADGWIKHNGEWNDVSELL